MGNWWLISYLSCSTREDFWRNPENLIFKDSIKKTNGTKSQRTPELLELSDTQVEPGSVQWVRMLVISWNDPSHENSKIPHPNQPPSPATCLFPPYFGKSPRINKKKKKLENKITWIFRFHLDFFMIHWWIIGDFESIDDLIFVETFDSSIRSRASDLEASLKEVAVVHRTRMEWTWRFFWAIFWTDFRKTSKIPRLFGIEKSFPDQ